MEAERKEELRQKLSADIESIREEIEALKGITKPISPDNAIGRLTRMDAIQSKSINEAVLAKAKIKLAKLENAIGRIDRESFGVCAVCEEDIPFERMLLMPESTRCVECASGSNR